jgi:NADPH:quinone reductase-like Zn-dependent oxidoreductase
MKAAVVTQFGRHWSIEVRDVPKPEPAVGEILVRVRASTVNRTDCGEMKNPYLMRLMSRAPMRKILGMDFAGEVEAVGPGVSEFKSGDRVFGMSPYGRSGAQAEYISLPASSAVTVMPEALAFDQAPVCEGAYYANGSVGKFVTSGCKTLIYGASGAIGTAAVQLAKYYGAEVTAVVEPRHVDMARSLRADHVVDYTKPEFEALGRNFDFILDAVGKMRIRDWQRLLNPHGHFAVTDLGPGGRDVPYMLWSSITRDGRVSCPLPPRGSAREFVRFLKQRMKDGQFRAIVDRNYFLDEIAEAYRYVYTGQKTGIVVIDQSG